MHDIYISHKIWRKLSIELRKSLLKHFRKNEVQGWNLSRTIGKLKEINKEDLIQKLLKEVQNEKIY